MRSKDRTLELLARGREQLEQGQYLEAEATLKDASQTAEAQAELVRLMHLLADPEAAAEHAARSAEVAGDHALSRLWSAVAQATDCLAHSEPERARTLLAEALGASKRADPEVRGRLLVLAAEADLALGNVFRAYKTADKAVQQAERPGILVPALRVVAAYALEQNKRETAEKQLLRARDLAEKADLLDEGVLTEQALLDLYPSSPDDENLERLEQAHGRAVAAIQRGGAALAASPERAEAYLAAPHRARLLAARAGRVSGQKTGESAPSESAVATAKPDEAEAIGPSGIPIIRRFVEIASLINSVLDLDELLGRVMDVAVDLIGAERGMIVLTESGSDEMTVSVARNLEGDAIQDVQKFSRGIIREAVQGREVITVDTTRDTALKGFKSVALYDILSVVCLPLRLRERIIGAVYLDNQKLVRDYTPEGLEFLRALTHLAAIAIENARLVSGLRRENVLLQKVATDRFKFANIVGSSQAMQRVFVLMEKAADSTFPVLLAGATGTGKEVIAKAIHFGSERKGRPFVAQNCAAIPSELLESEMFGYRRGAFTGADSDKKGLFEAANGGTLFLDEIGEMNMSLQAKLLRVLQDGLIRRVGDTAERKVDVRIISATNRDLKSGVDEGRFRLDLYYRLNVFQIDLPPLEQRREDIPSLAEHFLQKSNKSMQRAFKGFTRRALERLSAYAWPGNVRELENAVARAVVFAEADLIDIDSLPPFLTEKPVQREQELEVASGTPEVSHLARQLFEAMDLRGESFWEAVKKPFLRRDINRDVVREVVGMGLERSGWKYMRTLSQFNLPESEYRRFMNFLAKFDCKVNKPT